MIKFACVAIFRYLLFLTLYSRLNIASIDKVSIISFTLDDLSILNYYYFDVKIRNENV